jgi:asparagine N-glycosylation enzyme membrane subunit Stt3
VVVIARGLWPLQRGLAVRPVVTLALAGAIVGVLALTWRPSSSLLPAALASVVAIIVPVLLARGDGSRRRLAGRATGAAFVIAQPLILAGVLIDVSLLLPILAAGGFAILVPVVMPIRAGAASTQLAAERAGPA